MKRTLRKIAFITALSSSICFAQSTTSVVEDFKSSTFNQPGQEYPMVNSQGYARFKIVAPAADSVRVSLGLGGKGGTKLKKADDGTWMGTTEGPIESKSDFFECWQQRKTRKNLGCNYKTERSWFQCSVLCF